MDTFFDPYAAQLGLLGQIAIAAVLGGIIGLERELADKPAGIRTHMLVGAAASLLVGLSQVMLARPAGTAAELIRADPIRIIEAIVTGVAVLGAGTILRPADQDRVEGLTTAASLLFTAGIGIACALDQFVVAGVATFFVWVTLRALGWLEARHEDKLSKPTK